MRSLMVRDLAAKSERLEPTEPPRSMPEVGLLWNRHLKEPACVVGEQRQFHLPLGGFVKVLCNLGERVPFKDSFLFIASLALVSTCAGVFVFFSILVGCSSSALFIISMLSIFHLFQVLRSCKINYYVTLLKKC